MRIGGKIALAAIVASMPLGVLAQTHGRSSTLSTEVTSASRRGEASHTSPGATVRGVATFGQAVPGEHQRHKHRGCQLCRYRGYGGYIYSPYGAYLGADESTSAAYGSASDYILANGGTFYQSPQQPSNEAAPAEAPQVVVVPVVVPQAASNDTSANTAYVNSGPVSNEASASAESPAIVVFKDGTRREITNYAIYGAQIVVLATREKISIATLDVDATRKANEAAGYELHLPAVF